MPDTTLASALSSSQYRRLLIGRLISVDTSKILVDYPGNDLGPIAALATLTIFPVKHISDMPVLLGFADNAPDVPIVLGFIADRLPIDVHPSQPLPERPSLISSTPGRLSLQAQQMIEITCGESAITLKSDGTIIVKGRRLSSRAKEENKIKGGSVLIN